MWRKQKLKLLKTQTELNWWEDLRKDSTRNANYSWCVTDARRKGRKDWKKDNIQTFLVTEDLFGAFCCRARLHGNRISPGLQPCCLAQSKLTAQFYHLNISEQTSRPIRALLGQTLNPIIIIIIITELIIFLRFVSIRHLRLWDEVRGHWQPIIQPESRCLVRVWAWQTAWPRPRWWSCLHHLLHQLGSYWPTFIRNLVFN